MVIHDLHDLGYPHNLGNLRLMAAFLWSNIDVENQLFVHDVLAEAMVLPRLCTETNVTYPC